MQILLILDNRKRRGQSDPSIRPLSEHPKNNRWHGYPTSRYGNTGRFQAPIFAKNCKKWKNRTRQGILHSGDSDSCFPAKNFLTWDSRVKKFFADKSIDFELWRCDYRSWNIASQAKIDQFRAGALFMDSDDRREDDGRKMIVYVIYECSVPFVPHSCVSISRKTVGFIILLVEKNRKDPAVGRLQSGDILRERISIEDNSRRAIFSGTVQPQSLFHGPWSGVLTLSGFVHGRDSPIWYRGSKKHILGFQGWEALFWQFLCAKVARPYRKPDKHDGIYANVLLPIGLQENNFLSHVCMIMSIGTRRHQTC